MAPASELADEAAEPAGAGGWSASAGRSYRA